MDAIDIGELIETIRTLVLQLDRAETHFRRIYRSSAVPAIIEQECESALAAMAVIRADLGLAQHPEDTSAPRRS